MGRKLIRYQHQRLPSSEQMEPGGTLWRYVPTSDGQGRSLSDLMMILPIKGMDAALLPLIEQQLQEVLDIFGEKVHFAELNHRIGILWISIAAEPGLCSDLVDAIRGRIIGAKVVGSYVQRPSVERLSWFSKINRLISPP